MRDDEVCGYIDDLGPVRGNETDVGFWRCEWRADRYDGVPAFNRQSIPFSDEEIIKEFIKQRIVSHEEEMLKINGGWTQWDSLSYYVWEDINRKRLSDALAELGMKITFEDLKKSNSSWFKIEKA